MTWIDLLVHVTPCGLGNPFNNVRQILTGVEFCPQPANLNLLNSEFLTANSFRHKKDQNGWAELYAQSFAYHQFAKFRNDPRNTADTVVNGVLANQYFSCVSSYANQLVFGHYSPSLLGCPRTLPPWYRTFLKNQVGI